ncbi:MAG TPA: adenylate/guanylate cyclase domain-containing protein [Solirubrobacterales bacterium]|nr:adenylate/guanylate cyclase domain-containing protein [Solirubrobacterales bacterium]
MEGRSCPSCGAQNPDRAHFCMSCGSKLAPICPSCGAENPSGARFCIECGFALSGETARSDSGPAAPPAARPAAAEAPPEERRQATVLFADLSGYTAAAERMDPEAVKALVGRTLRRLGQEIERFGGTIDKFIGDNVMGVFGAPVAHEDDPERAVRAGLAMQGAMEDANRQSQARHGVSFSLRVGINSGEVMAGAVGDRYTVMGDVVNVAARLQAAARPKSVTVGESTYRSTREVIAYERLEPLSLKGKEEPVPAWEACRALTEPRRRTSRAQTPLIGREEEASLLVSLVDRVAHEGRPHLVTVVGQAGVGKSRLLRELISTLIDSDPPPTIRRGQCPPYGSGIAYWALAEVLNQEFEIRDTDPPEVAWEKLRSGVSELLKDFGDREAAERNARLLAIPLGLEPPEEPTQVDSDPQRMREALFSAARAVVEAIARRRPLVLAIDDIHWADEGMLDLIDHLTRFVRAPLLLVCLTRDELLERRPGWGGGRRNATTISLEPLTAEETRQLVAALMPERTGDGDGAPVDVGDVVPQVAERSGGNPLFAEEMVNRLLEQETVEAEALPTTVQSLLAARLDSLDRLERRLLQSASVVGQTFWEGALASTAAEEGLDLARTLATLEEKDLLAPSAVSRLAGEREYAFKHVLIRDVAYSMLPKSVRCRKHVEVAEFIRERAGERSDAVIGLIAEHFARAAALGSEAGLDSEALAELQTRALDSLEAAGDAAAALYSNAEAFDRYTAALELSDALDEGIVARIGEKQGDVALRMGRVDAAVSVWERCLEHHRAQEDLARVADLHRKIGAALWHKGERRASIDNYQRGIDLLKDGPPCIELVRLYEEAASLYMHTGDNMLAIYASEKALRLAERLGEARAASRAHGIFGRVFGRIGDSVKARENLERSVALARDSDRAEAVRALLTLGYHLEISEADYAGATEAYREALEIAQEVGDLPSQVELHASLGQLAVESADWEEVERATEASARLAEREGLHGKLCFPEVMRGVLAWREGEWEEAARCFRRAHELGEQVGRSEVAFTALQWLAITLRDSGDLAAAETELTRALDICERAGLIAQSVEAISARAVVLALSGRDEQARAAAEEAERLAGRLHYPVGEAATAEAAGAAADDPDECAKRIEEARKRWLELGRPLDAARCLAIRGRLLLADDPDAGSELIDAAAAEYEALGAPALAARARETVEA